MAQVEEPLVNERCADSTHTSENDGHSGADSEERDISTYILPNMDFDHLPFKSNAVEDGCADSSDELSAVEPPTEGT